MPTTKKIAVPRARKPRTAKTIATREEIALRAYEIYLERSGAPGNAFEDWTRAERELLEGPPKLRQKASLKDQAA
jgi:hypothetical protein